MLSPREAEITQLLLDWADAFPPESVSIDDTSGPGGNEGSYGGSEMPLNLEAMWRADKGSLVGETYAILERELGVMRELRPNLYRAISAAYLDPDVSHSEVDHWRRNAKNGSMRYQLWVLLHDNAIKWIAQRLQDEHLWVRWPDKVHGGNLKPMEERYEEVVRIFDMYMDQGITPSKSKNMTAEKCDLSLRHVQRIIKARQDG